MNVNITINDVQMKCLLDALTITLEEYREWSENPTKEMKPSVSRVVLARAALGLSLDAEHYVIGYVPPPFEVIGMS